MAVEVAKGIHDHPEFKLGSILGSGKADQRTVNFMDFLDPKQVVAPTKWDFDKNRKPFPKKMWGNDNYGDCELAGRANYVNRLQRGQTKTSSPIVDDDVVALYKEMTGCQSPGDNNDSGLTTLDNLREWRTGWLPESLKAKPDHKYQIAAFGQVDTKNHTLFRLSSYLFSGLLLGCNMPITAQQQTSENKPWDVVAGAGSNADPGSWGGHCVYTKRYDDGNIYVLTWAREVQVTDAWMREYCDEAYAVIESFDVWTNYKHVFDVKKLIQAMTSAGINVQQ